MADMNQKDSFDKIKAIYAMIAVAGVVWVLGVVGEMDRKDEETYKEQNLWYGKNAQETNPIPIKKMVPGAIAIGIGAVGFNLRNRKKGQER